MAKPNKTEPEATAMTAPPATTALVEYESYGEDAGKGRENQTTADRKIPWMEILQPGSPDVASGKLKAGDFRNKLTGTVYDGKVGIVITPATTREAYVEWVERDEKDAEGNTGYVGEHAPTSKLVAEARAATAAAGRKFNDLPVPGREKHLLQQTFYMPSVHHEPNGELMPVMLAFTSTHIKPYQVLQTLTDFKVRVKDPDGNGIHDESPPLYAHRVRMTTEVNTQGKFTWYTPVFAPAEGDSYKATLMRAKDAAFQAAKAFKKLFEVGGAKVDYAAQGQGGGAAKEDEKVPF